MILRTLFGPSPLSCKRGQVDRQAQGDHISTPRFPKILNQIREHIHGFLYSSTQLPLPVDTVVYAIGDVHGEDTLLRDLHDRIWKDATQRKAARRVLIHLGDYVDRGPNPKAVLERLAKQTWEGFEIINLLGNHDQWLADFLTDPIAHRNWLLHGGLATIRSYGIDANIAFSDKALITLRDELENAVPLEHRALLAKLIPYHREDGYLFVHAGLVPGKPLEDHRLNDFLSTDSRFLRSTADHGYVVVHGHVQVKRPEFRRNRIAVDTGAYRTRRLSAVVLQGSEYKVFYTSEYRC